MVCQNTFNVLCTAGILLLQILMQIAIRLHDGYMQKYLQQANVGSTLAISGTPCLVSGTAAARFGVSIGFGKEEASKGNVHTTWWAVVHALRSFSGFWSKRSAKANIHDHCMLIEYFCDSRLPVPLM